MMRDHPQPDSERLMPAVRVRSGHLWVAPPWAILLAACAAVLTFVDTFLTARTTALFTGGWESLQLDHSVASAQ
jgi:hypothetical protein